MAAATKQQTPAADQVIDPKFEWAEKAGSYVLRLTLPGFRKDDFRVQVDGTSRLTVRGTRPGTGAAGQSSFNKIFQLPSAAIHDDISGRFEADVLTLTVPKRAAGAGAPAPTSSEEIRRKMPGVAKEENKTRKEEIANEDALNKKDMDVASKKARQQQKQEEEPRESKQEQQTPPPKLTPVKKEEELKSNAPQAAAGTPPPEKPAPRLESDTVVEKGKAVVATESLAERVRRRSEDEGADAAATMAAAKRAKMDGEKKARAECVGWKERVQGELKVLTEMKWAEGLTDMKWADGVAEAARKNNEVVVVGVAAFSLGFLVSYKLFGK